MHFKVKSIYTSEAIRYFRNIMHVKKSIPAH